MKEIKIDAATVEFPDLEDETKGEEIAPFGVVGANVYIGETKYHIAKGRLNPSVSTGWGKAEIYLDNDGWAEADRLKELATHYAILAKVMRMLDEKFV
jgi:hypothetical protein